MIKTLISTSVFVLAAQMVSSNAVAYSTGDDPAASIVDSFEKKFGVTKGKRRNHTKGFCFEATLVPDDKAIQQYSKSVLFKDESMVVGRLSHKGGNNLSADNKHADYGMGLAMTPNSGGTHLMSMNTQNFFPVATPEAFAELMHAIASGGDAVKEFKEKSPDLQRFKAHEAKRDKTLKPYEGTQYNSVNSFYLINDEGTKTAIRWSFVPVKDQGIVVEPKQDFFFENMQSNLNAHEITWNMVVTIANTDDVVDNAALPWVGEHKKINAAKLTVSSVQTEENGKCDNINYDPMVLTEGFEPSADPLLQARRNSYAISSGKRAGEK